MQVAKTRRLLDQIEGKQRQANQRSFNYLMDVKSKAKKFNTQVEQLHDFGSSRDSYEHQMEVAKQILNKSKR